MYICMSLFEIKFIFKTIDMGDPFDEQPMST